MSWPKRKPAPLGDGPQPSSVSYDSVKSQNYPFFHQDQTIADHTLDPHEVLLALDLIGEYGQVCL